MSAGNRVYRPKQPMKLTRICFALIVTMSLVGQEVGIANASITQPKSDLSSHPACIQAAVTPGPFLGGTPVDISVDSQGYIYVVGRVSTPSFQVTANALDNTCGSDGACNGLEWGADSFVAKLTPDGSEVVYATYLGGNSSDVAQALAVDNAGNIYVAGTTYSPDFPATLSRHIPGGNLQDIFVVKISSDGDHFSYSALIGGIDTEYVFDIAVDEAGAAYITGYTFSDDFPITRGAWDSTLKRPEDYYDAYIVKIAPDGSDLVYSTFLGGEATDESSAIAVNNAGEVYVVGRTMSRDFPTTHGAYQPQVKGFPSDNVFVTKLSADGGSLIYSTLLGRTASPVGPRDIALSSTGEAVVLITMGQDELSSSDGTVNITSGDILVKVKDDGTDLLWGGHFKGIQSIDTDSQGNLYMTGSTDNPLLATQGAFDTEYNDKGDAFVAKLDLANTVLNYATYLGGSEWDTGKSIIADGKGNAYVVVESASTDFESTGVFFVDMLGSATRPLPSPAPQEPFPGWSGDPPAEPFAVANFESFVTEKQTYIHYLSEPMISVPVFMWEVDIPAAGYDESEAEQLLHELQGTYEKYSRGELSPEEFATFDRQASAFTRLTIMEQVFSELYPMYITTTVDFSTAFFAEGFLIWQLCSLADELKMAENIEDFLPEPVPGESISKVPPGYTQALRSLLNQTTKLLLSAIDESWDLALDWMRDKEQAEDLRRFKDLLFDYLDLMLSDDSEEAYEIVFEDALQGFLSWGVTEWFMLDYVVERHQPVLDEGVSHVHDAADEVAFMYWVHAEDQQAREQVNILIAPVRDETAIVHQAMEDQQESLDYVELLAASGDLMQIIFKPFALWSYAGRLAQGTIIFLDGAKSFDNLQTLDNAVDRIETCAFNPRLCRPAASSNQGPLQLASTDLSPYSEPLFFLTNRAVNRDTSQVFLSTQLTSLDDSIAAYLELQQNVVDGVQNKDFARVTELLPSLLEAEDALNQSFSIAQTPLRAAASLPEAQTETFSQAYRQLFAASSGLRAQQIFLQGSLAGFIVNSEDETVQQELARTAENVEVAIIAYRERLENVLPSVADLVIPPKVIIQTSELDKKKLNLNLINATPTKAENVSVTLDEQIFEVGNLDPAQSTRVSFSINQDEKSFYIVDVWIDEQWSDSETVFVQEETTSVFDLRSIASLPMPGLLFGSLLLICFSGVGLLSLGGYALLYRRKRKIDSKL